jgi:hypothetical protein
MAKTLYDVVNAPKSAQIELEDCVIVKQQDDGTYNVACTINGSKTYVNFVNPSKCANNKLYVKFGKKEENWKKERWFQVDAPTDEEKTKEDK